MTSLRPCGTSFHLTCMKKIVLQRTHLHCADCVEEFTKYGPNDQKMTCIYAIRAKAVAHLSMNCRVFTCKYILCKYYLKICMLSFVDPKDE